MSVHLLIQPDALEPEAIAAMGEAFETAVRDLGGAQSEVMREIIAGRIIAAARFGERDPVHLRTAALAMAEKD